MQGFKQFIAEIIGTAFLMCGGCMGCLSWGPQEPNILGALSFGMVVMILIQSYGHISGAHFNPAVTVAAVFFRLINIPVCDFNAKKKNKTFYWHSPHIAQNNVLTFIYRWLLCTFSPNWSVLSLVIDCCKHWPQITYSQRIAENMVFVQPDHMMMSASPNHFSSNMSQQRCWFPFAVPFGIHGMQNIKIQFRWNSVSPLQFFRGFL